MLIGLCNDRILPSSMTGNLLPGPAKYISETFDHSLYFYLHFPHCHCHYFPGLFYPYPADFSIYISYLLHPSFTWPPEKSAKIISDLHKKIVTTHFLKIKCTFLFVVLKTYFKIGPNLPFHVQPLLLLHSPTPQSPIIFSSWRAGKILTLQRLLCLYIHAILMLADVSLPLDIFEAS